MVEITDEMVERALEMFYRDWGQEHPIFYPQDYSTEDRCLLSKIMRAALEAALGAPQGEVRCADCGQPLGHGLACVAVEHGKFVCVQRCWKARNGR